jgi:ubiquinone/menaquinone biosynthesis C-methylase UbiE
MNSSFDSKERFSNRVENYIKYRPDYPKEIIDSLKEKIYLNSSWAIADIGSGTGILSKLFLENGNEVFGVEPNEAMRKAGEKQLINYKNFTSTSGNAEETGLKNKSIELITAGQAFHWFDVEKSKIEFKRILKKDGYVLLIWNNRKVDSSSFLVEYENLLINYCIDYQFVNHKNFNNEILKKFFVKYELKTFPNWQVFDLKGLKGRLLSSSYAPMPDHPKFKLMIEKLEEIFIQNETRGKVKFEYDTELYFGII